MPEAPETLDIIDAVWRAYHSPIGVVIRGDQQRIRGAFYAARATDPLLTGMGLFNSPFAVDEFYIIKREVYNEYRKKRREAREKDNALSGGGLGLPDGLLPTEGSDDFPLDP